MMPILRLEAFLVFGLTLALYHHLDYSWWMFALGFFVPDISLIGYVKNAKWGAYLYNIAHSYVSPFTLAALLFVIFKPLIATISLIWVSHIAFDRVLGFGLKHISGFKDTHLGRI